MQFNVVLALQSGQQQLHQWTVIQDPTNSVVVPVGGSEIGLVEQDPRIRGTVP
jgi:hypothetical protein